MRLVYFLDAPIFHDLSSGEYFYRSAPGVFGRELARRCDSFVLAAPVISGEDPRKHGFGGALGDIDVWPLTPWGGIAGALRHRKRVRREILALADHALQHESRIWIKYPTLAGTMFHDVLPPSQIIMQVGGDILKAWRMDAHRGWRRAPAWMLANVLHQRIREQADVSLNFLQGSEVWNRYQSPKSHRLIFSQVHDKDLIEWRDRCQRDLIRVLFVGQIRAEKGVFRLIDACRCSTDVRVELHLIGDGPDQVRVQAHADRLDNVIYHGFVPFGAELFAHYRNADIFCLPTQYPEGFPRVILEAWASCLPVITTRTSGVTAIGEHMVNTVILDTGDAEEIRASIDMLATNHTLRCQLTHHALRTVARYTVEQQVSLALTAITSSQ